MQKTQSGFVFRVLFKLHPKRKNLLRGQLVQALRRRTTVSRGIFLELMLFRIQLQELLLNFRNAVFGIEHFVQFFGERSRFLI